jgi:hypothetical protein
MATIERFEQLVAWQKAHAADEVARLLNGLIASVGAAT